MQNNTINTTPVKRLCSASLASLLKLADDTPMPAETDVDFEYYLYERYCKSSVNWKQKAFYFIKPVLPHTIQVAIRKQYSKIQGKAKFPAWPIEQLLVKSIDKYLTLVLKASGQSEIQRIAPWPEGKKFAVALTHDVEGQNGFQQMLRLADMEKDYGFRSSWNIVPEGYPIDWNIVNKLRSDSFELGIHGLRHDGKLFHSVKDFRSQIVEIRQYAELWNVVGFRSPSTLRNVDWIHELGFEYDSSYHDTAPYEPQPGGCCSIWPYFIKDLVELPITLPQDHTLFHVLGYEDISIWKTKVNWIEKYGGLVLIDVHPDYMIGEDRWNIYREFLEYIKDKQDAWYALPCEIAKWWRDRDASHLLRRGDQYTIEGNIASRAAIIRTTLSNGMLNNEVKKVVNT